MRPPRFPCPNVAALAAALLALVLPAGALASPWTLQRGEIAAVGSFDYQWANEEFLDEGGSRPFPLDGRFQAATFTVGVRGGFTDHLELELQLPVRIIDYEADPVILFDRDPAAPIGEGEFYRDNVLDLARSATGIGDLVIAGRYGFIRNPVALAMELRINTPTGYDRPSGTFGDEPDTAEEFLADPARFVRPENINDDVTLGDGVFGMQGSILFGASFPTRTFVRVDAGYNLRFGDGGDLLVASLKAGQLLGRRVLLYGDVRLTYTLVEGDVIGISVAAADPNRPANQYRGLDNLVLREVRLDRDALDVTVGGIVRITDEVEMNLGYARTVWGRNTAAINAVYLSLGVRTSVIADDDD
jgi:hypothetical protein